jgi:hypothetical protein
MFLFEPKERLLEIHELLPLSNRKYQEFTLINSAIKLWLVLRLLLAKVCSSAKREHQDFY